MDPSNLAICTRSGVTEEYHPGAVAVIAPDGSLVASSGDVDRPFFIRSSAKPFQATACLEAGLELPPLHLALASASHSGDPVHIALVSAILAAGGVSESDLRCPPDRPFASADRRLASRSDVAPRRIYHNCSGKHAAMLAASTHAGWPTDSYLDPSHPLQRRVAGVLSDVVETTLDDPGVDGCGAPVWTVTTRQLANAYRHLGSAARFSRVRSVLERYPMLVSGEGRPDGLIGRWLGAAVKGGAAGCMGASYGGFGVAAKAWSGSGRVAGMGVMAGLEMLGCVTSSLRAALNEVVSPPVTGGGEVVGRYFVDQGLEKA